MLNPRWWTKTKICVSAIAAMAALLAAQGFASQAITVQIPGIVGDSSTVNFIGQIDADSVSWGFHTDNSVDAGAVILAPIIVTKTLDSSSSLLMAAGATNKTFTTLTIHHIVQTTSTTKPIESTTILTNARVTDYQMLDRVDGGPPLESITFAATAINFSHTKVDQTGKVLSSDKATITAGPLKK